MQTGLDQREFATKIGVKPSTYATYETGRNEPRYRDVFSLAKRVEALTHIPASWLIGHPSDYFAVVSDLAARRATKARPDRSSGTTHPRGRVA